MAYFCFYDIQVFTVMQQTTPDSMLRLLKELYQTAQNYNK